MCAVVTGHGVKHPFNEERLSQQCQQFTFIGMKKKFYTRGLQFKVTCKRKTEMCAMPGMFSFTATLYL